MQLYEYFYHKEHLFIVCELLRDNLYEVRSSPEPKLSHPETSEAENVTPISP